MGKSIRMYRQEASLTPRQAGRIAAYLQAQGYAVEVCTQIAAEAMRSFNSLDPAIFGWAEYEASVLENKG
jgi:hypothetical protein